MVRDPEALRELLSSQCEEEDGAEASAGAAASPRPWPEERRTGGSHKASASSVSASAAPVPTVFPAASGGGDVAVDEDEEEEDQTPAATEEDQVGFNASARNSSAARPEGTIVRLQRSPLVLGLALAMFSSVMGMVYIYLRGWYVLLVHGREDCDQPIALWLLGCQLLAPLYFARGWVRKFVYRRLCFWNPPDDGDQSRVQPCRVRLLGSIFCFLCYYILFSGVDLVKDARSCQSSAPGLFKWAAYLFPSGVVHFFGLQVIAVCSSAGLLAAVHRARYGQREEALRGVDLEAVLEKLETVEVGQGRLLECQCSICLDNYTAEQKVKALACCGNVIHEECLKEWLQRRRTCPLCRADLQAATASNEGASSEDRELPTETELPV